MAERRDRWMQACLQSGAWMARDLAALTGCRRNVQNIAEEVADHDERAEEGRADKLAARGLRRAPLQQVVLTEHCRQLVPT